MFLNPLVSIIIPTYNRAHLIGETLDSILAQTYTNWECIIVDDGSTDDTETVIVNYIKKDSRFQFYKRPIDKLKGPNSCRNYGFNTAKGDLIQWFDSDDLLDSNAFESYINEFEKSTSLDVVIAKIKMVELNTNLLIKENFIFSKNIIEDYFLGKIAYYVCGPMWKSSFLKEQKLLFDENISNLDDWDFNLRMLYAYPKIAYSEKSLIQYRVHEKSLSHEIGKLNFDEIKSELFAREKHFKLIEQNKKVNVLVLKKFIIKRYKYFFREAMVQKDEHRFFYLKNLLKKEVELFYFRDLVKTIIGFTIFTLFNKGYKILK